MNVKNERGGIGVKKTGGFVLKMIKDNFISLAGFEFIFKASAFILFVPLIVSAVNIATDNAGLLYITTRNVAQLMKNPVMIIMIAAVLVITMCISYYEVCCIWSCCSNYNKGIKSRISDMFADGFIHLRKTSRRYGMKIFIQMAAVFPLLSLHMALILCYRVDILQSCIKYIFGGMHIRLIAAVVAVASLFGFSAVTQKFGKTMSEKETGGRYFLRRTAGLAAANIIIAAVLAVLYFILIVIAAVVLRFFTSEKFSLVYLIRFEDYMYYFLAFAAGSLGMIVNNALIFSWHDRARHTGEHTRRKRGFRRRIISVLLVIVFAADVSRAAGYVINGSHVLEDIFIGTRVTAHRGGAKFVPENTMYGVRYAIESGADYIEIDVQLSADGVVFLLHDENLKRTTGKNRLAFNLTYDEIAALDAGSYFGNEFSDAYIPTLDEVLRECKSKINLNIEIKKSREGKELVNKVLDLIESYDMKEQCVVTSTEYAYLRQIKQQKPEIKTGFISNMLYGEAASLEYADFFSVKYVVVSESFVRNAHSAGKEVHVWTVNTKSLIERMKALDVDCIITDNPVLCRKIISRKNGRKTFAEILQAFLYKK